MAGVQIWSRRGDVCLQSWHLGWEVGGSSKVQYQPWLLSEFKASLGDMRPSLKQTKIFQISDCGKTKSVRDETPPELISLGIISIQTAGILKYIENREKKFPITKGT